MAVILSALQDATEHLRTAVSLAEKYRQENNAVYYRQFRTSAIQSFEYCYELSVKLMRRYVNEADISEREGREAHLRDMLRMAAEFGFITEPMKWMGYREERNKTAHGYNEGVAEELYKQLPDFVKSVEYLLARLRRIENASE